MFIFRVNSVRLFTYYAITRDSYYDRVSLKRNKLHYFLWTKVYRIDMLDKDECCMLNETKRFLSEMNTNMLFPALFCIPAAIIVLYMPGSVLLSLKSIMPHRDIDLSTVDVNYFFIHGILYFISLFEKSRNHLRKKYRFGEYSARIIIALIRRKREGLCLLPLISWIIIIECDWYTKILSTILSGNVLSIWLRLWRLFRKLITVCLLYG